MRRILTAPLALLWTQPQRLTLWMPLVSASIGVAILVVLSPSSTFYLGVLAYIIIYDAAALFGPSRARPALLRAAPHSYSLVFVFTWISGLYLLPGFRDTPLVLLACALHLPSIYAFFFLQQAPRRAARNAVILMTAVVLGTLPHAWNTAFSVAPFNGPTLPITLFCANGALIAVLFLFSKVSDQLAQERTTTRLMHQLAHQDALTGLHNRRALEEDLVQEVSTSRRRRVLAMIDVDGLKEVNDTLGHAAGDDLLRRFGHGFTRLLRPEDRAYRMGGDEFALLSTDTSEIVRIVAEVREQVRTVYLQAGASVGTAEYQLGDQPEEWLSRADRAMYRQKHRRVT